MEGELFNLMHRAKSNAGDTFFNERTGSFEGVEMVSGLRDWSLELLLPSQ